MDYRRHFGYIRLLNRITAPPHRRGSASQPADACGCEFLPARDLSCRTLHPRGEGSHRRPQRRLPGQWAVRVPATALATKWPMPSVWPLDLVSRALVAPHRNWAIQMEPRVVGSEGATCWDIGIDSPDTLFEVKLNPTRADILDWLTRVSAEVPSSPDRGFSLVYSKGSGPWLAALGRVLRVAVEAAGDAGTFQQLLDLEQVQDAPEILGRLGEHPHVALRHEAGVSPGGHPHQGH